MLEQAPPRRNWSHMSHIETRPQSTITTTYFYNRANVYKGVVWPSNLFLE
jgi:hypothetical protein